MGDFYLLIQQVLNGMTLGSGYALFGFGFGLVYATMGILNVAYGQVAVFGAVSAYFAWDIFGWPIYAVIPISMIAGAILMVVVDQVAFQPLRKRSRPISFIITGIGMWFILLGSIGKFTSFEDRSFNYDFLPFGTLNLAG